MVLAWKGLVCSSSAGFQANAIWESFFRFGNESKLFMLIVTNRHGGPFEKTNAWTLQVQPERESEGAFGKNKCLHLLILPWAPSPTCVSKRREQTPKINRLSQTQSTTSSPTTEIITTKKGKSVCVQCVVRPGVYVQGTAKVSQIYAWHSPRCELPRVGWARGSATHQRAWTAQSLIQTTPCTMGGSGRGQCLGILLWTPSAFPYAGCTGLAAWRLCISSRRERRERDFNLVVERTLWYWVKGKGRPSNPQTQHRWSQVFHMTLANLSAARQIQLCGWSHTWHSNWPYLLS